MMKYVKASYKLLIGCFFCCNVLFGCMFVRAVSASVPDGHFWLYVIDVPDHLWFWSYRFEGMILRLEGSFMVMAIAGAAVLTQIKVLSPTRRVVLWLHMLYPAVAFAVIAYYGLFIARKQELTAK